MSAAYVPQIGDRVAFDRRLDGKGERALPVDIITGDVDWTDGVQALVIPDGNRYPRRWLVAVSRLRPYEAAS